MKPTVAIVGSGVSGLTAAYVMRDSHEVTVLEQDTRFGGHAHTHAVATDDGQTVAVDSGFIVHNERTYPNLLRIFRELGVETQPTEMSMGITCGGCGLSYAGGRGVRGVLAQPWRILDPRFDRMLVEVPRLHRAAKALLAGTGDQRQTWGEFLANGRYSTYFIRHFAIPLVSCVWSSSDEETRAYPARHLFEFLDHHGMLTITNSPTWRTVVGGSRTYVDRITALLPNAHRGRGVASVARNADGVDVTTVDGETRRFDRAIIATHANSALALLSDATEQERADLAAIPYSTNETWLHRDSTVLPKRDGARASWNYRMSSCDTDSSSVLVSYWMNKLMRIHAKEDFVVTLNPDGWVDEKRVIARMAYEHPVFTLKAVEAAKRLNGSGGAHLAFAGAHLGWGFHEDGARSGAEAARKFGVRW
jgi:predicted NAD/FAD-binding protein